MSRSVNAREFKVWRRRPQREDRVRFLRPRSQRKQNEHEKSAHAISPANPCRCLVRRKRPRGDICVDQSHCPFDRVRVHLLQSRIVPVVLWVTKSRIVDASLTVHFGPSYREVAIGPVNFGIRQVKFASIETHQHPHFVARVVSDLVNFISKSERPWPLLHTRKSRILHEDGSIERAPRMLVEVTTNHLAIFRPVHEGDSSAVDSYETFSIIMHKR